MNPKGGYQGMPKNGQGYITQGTPLNNQGYGGQQTAMAQGYGNGYAGVSGSTMTGYGNQVQGYANQSQGYSNQPQGYGGNQGMGSGVQYGQPIYGSNAGLCGQQGVSTLHSKAVKGQGQGGITYQQSMMTNTGDQMNQCQSQGMIMGSNQGYGGGAGIHSGNVVTGLVVGGTAPQGMVQVAATPIEVPKKYIDKQFTKELFNEPVKTPDGNVFEREPLLQFIALKKHDPISYNYLEESYLENNLALKQQIEGWLLDLRVDILIGNPAVLELVGKWINARGRDKLKENMRLCKIVEIHDNTMQLRGGYQGLD